MKTTPLHQRVAGICLAAASLVYFCQTSLAQENAVQTLAPNVYFHEGEHGRGHSNNGWVVLDDYVIAIDANYPSGAKVVIPKVRSITTKPIRFVVDTHHHGDHAFGNQLWADEGATILAHAAAHLVLKESGPASWQSSAQRRPDVAASTLKLPSLLFKDTLVFDDGQTFVELHWLGVSHTRGDVFIWLPRQKILFTGDACVNGPFNNVRDGDTGEWIKTLELAKKLGAEKVCPGHGPMGGPEIIVDQQLYFFELRRGVQALVDAKKTPAEVKVAIPELATELKKNAQIARFVPGNLLGHAEKVYRELGGEALPR